MANHNSETPLTNQQVITACAFIHHTFDGVKKVFLPKRAATKKFLPGVYELPGGHIEYGEDIIGGLKREIKEELGMTVNVGDPFAAFTYTNETKGSHSIEVLYFVQFEGSVENVKLNTNDHSEAGWFSEVETLKVMGEQRVSDDPEIQNIKKGFSLLRGNQLIF